MGESRCALCTPEVLAVRGGHLGSGRRELLRCEGTMLCFPLSHGRKADPASHLTLGSAGDQPRQGDGRLARHASHGCEKILLESDRDLTSRHTFTIPEYDRVGGGRPSPPT